MSHRTKRTAAAAVTTAEFQTQLHLRIRSHKPKYQLSIACDLEFHSIHSVVPNNIRASIENSKSGIPNIIRILCGDDLKNNIGWIPCVSLLPNISELPGHRATACLPACLTACMPAQREHARNGFYEWKLQSCAMATSLRWLFFFLPFHSFRVVCCCRPLVRLRFASFAMQYGSSNSFHIIIIIIIVIGHQPARLHTKWIWVWILRITFST